MPEWITKYWVEYVFGLIIAFLSFTVKRLSKKLKEFRAEQKAERQAMLALLDDSIGRIADKSIPAGHISTDALRRCTRLYESYEKLGGNGAVTTIVDHIKALPIVDQPR